jgi:transposase
MTIIAQKIRIYPNNKQKTALEGAFGTSRFAYNWAIQQCLDSKKTGERYPTGYDLSKQFNAGF